MTPPVSLSPFTIVVVEDDAESAAVFQYILRVNGYSVRMLTDGESALVELQREPPEAIIIDLHLPAMGGLELLRRIRASGLPNLPVAVITGDYLVDEQVVHDLEALGAQLYFKPLWEEDLIRAAAKLMACATGSSPPDRAASDATT